VESHQGAERELRAFLASAAARIPDCRITVRKFSENFSCFRSPDRPFFAAMARSVRRVRRAKPAFSVSTGFNDMHFFAQELKLPTLGYGPGGKAYHAVDERARVRDVLSAAKVYADLLTTFEG
jgi:succinyl-diaminopimelate desuccinylase